MVEKKESYIKEFLILALAIVVMVGSFLVGQQKWGVCVSAGLAVVGMVTASAKTKNGWTSFAVAMIVVALVDVLFWWLKGAGF